MNWFYGTFYKNDYKYKAMKPVAILSSDTSPDYITLLPIVQKSWELQGWDTRIMIVDNHKTEKEDDLACYINFFIPSVRTSLPIPPEGMSLESVNEAVYAQCVRMYMPNNVWIDSGEDRYCILSDADMFIGSSFLNRDFDRVNCFGYDLTGYTEVPMCYVGAYCSKWAEIMKYSESNIFNDLEKISRYKSPIYGEAWGSDQQILTRRLKQYSFDRINFINRGSDQNNDGLPMGRWDRHNWVKPSGEVHDCHLPRDPMNEHNFRRIKEMCIHCYPAENWDWLDEYRDQVMKILK